jgi:hypothetical protein
MDTVQNSAADKLYKKLTALRVTLPNDEREVFDQIIPAEEEVTAHRFAKKKSIKARTKKAPEVTAHQITKKATKKVTKKTTKKAAK